MTMLDTVHHGVRQTPPRLLVYGTEGIGKSTLASQAPSPIFVQTEDGLDRIDCASFPMATTFDAVMNALRALYAEPHDYRTVVVDSLDWLERLAWDAVCLADGVDSIEKVGKGYAKGYTEALTEWRRVLTGLDALRSKRGMAVIMIAHSKIEKFEDPESVAYDRYSPRLHKHACALLTEWADAVFFATRKLYVKTEDAGFNRQRAIAQPVGDAGGDRVLRCVGGPSCVAKNRYGLAAELPLTQESLLSVLNGAAKGDK
ncbi:MAG: ATP-binding protein [Phycisphaerae bacterium]